MHTIRKTTVRKDKTGKGIGNILLEKGIEIARKFHLGSIELHVWSFNEDAIKFYKKKGFQEFSIKMRKEI